MSTEPAAPAWWWRDISLGDEGEDVKIVQKKLLTDVTGVYDDATAARVRGMEKLMGRKKQTGVVDAKVAEEIGEKPTKGQIPDWYGKPQQESRLRVILKLSMLESVPDGIRRFQSANGLALTGEVDVDLAILLGNRSA